MGLCLSVRLSLCTFVCLLHAGIVSKRLDESSWFMAWRLPPPIQRCSDATVNTSQRQRRSNKCFRYPLKRTHFQTILACQNALNSTTYSNSELQKNSGGGPPDPPHSVEGYEKGERKGRRRRTEKTGWREGRNAEGAWEERGGWKKEAFSKTKFTNIPLHLFYTVL